MIGIGRHTDYAARIVLHLACLPQGAQVTAAQVARLRRLPPPFVRRIVARLAATGILRTVRGNRGGISLARPPAEISLLDLVRAMEGGVDLNFCVSTPSSCPLVNACPVHRTWTRLTRSLEQELDAVRFDTLANPLEHRVAHLGYQQKLDAEASDRTRRPRAAPDRKRRQRTPPHARGR